MTYQSELVSCYWIRISCTSFSAGISCMVFSKLGQTNMFTADLKCILKLATSKREPTQILRFFFEFIQIAVTIGAEPGLYSLNPFRVSKKFPFWTFIAQPQTQHSPLGSECLATTTLVKGAPVPLTQTYKCEMKTVKQKPA